MKKRIDECKAKEVEKLEAEKLKLQSQATKDSDKAKSVEQKQLDKQTQSVRQSMQEDLVREKEVIKREIASLANQSSEDVDEQIADLRQETLGPKLRAEVRTLESEFERKIEVLKNQQAMDSQEQKRKV